MILIVENDENIRYVLSYIVEEKGFRHREVESVGEAFSEIFKLIPSMILFGVSLFDEEASRLFILCKNSFPQIKLVMLTTMNAVDTARVVNEFALQYFLNKPFQLDELDSILNTVSK